jgi:hypothetical protein
MEKNLMEEMNLLEEALLLAQTRARDSDDKKTEIEEQHETLLREFEEYKKKMKDFIETIQKTLKVDSEVIVNWLKEFEETQFSEQSEQVEQVEKLKFIIEEKFETLNSLKDSLSMREKLSKIKMNIEVFISGKISNPLNNDKV